AHYVRGAQRVVRVQPGAKERCDLARQSEQDVTRMRRAGGGGGLEDRFQVLVGELRNDRRDVDTDGNARRRELVDDLEPALRSGRARVELAREIAVQHRDGDEDAHKV